MASAERNPLHDPQDPLLGTPRSVGEIITESVQGLRDHLRAVVLLMLPFCAVELVLREAATTLASRARAALGQGAILEEGLRAILDHIVVPLAGAIGLLVLSLCVAIALVATATVHAAHALRGEPLTPGESLRRGMRLWPKVVAAEIVFDLALIAVTILPWSIGLVAAAFTEGFLQWFIIGLTAAVWIALLLSLYLRWVLFLQAIVLEGCGPLTALVRSSELMSPAGVRLSQGPKLRFSLVVLVYWVVASVVQSTFLLPLGVFGFMEGIPLEELPPPLADVPFFVAIPVAVVQVLANSVLYPLKAYLPTLFYFDLQVRYGALPGDDVPAPDVGERTLEAEG